MELSDIIGVDAVRAPLKATSKKRLLQDLAEMAETVYGLPAATVYKSLMEREGLGPTGVGRGVAIPHARFEGVNRVIGLFARLEKPVDFESIDRQPVDLVFALFAPESAGAEHLKALARVSRTLRNEAVCAKLRSTFDPSAIFAILTDGKAEQAA
ncbi:MAG TPA: PTS sugar transporter subunit IIA [Amaricoccus sp.]|uniref:PTS sugar transporter subunit IIA n=1 Tax=Amaricoccus sp. TaxID=1872485 RepID=UPI002C6E245D|nr:PTS sugar transporter subunit IIA [Amaricoccus sp.]HMQ91505.1 PTS sugar transporter subunit IIA [Amaricoccus sp.]HMR50924.1 PTS sugar transporter subunit IIA [Amaricoccus sp.]HMR58905.1 PTS sugar transporter subunit IIA [Amaricoccus sp.]HMT97897.1 PTS sugar transporter subunit IIA [Amaricoccus sp.]